MKTVYYVLIGGVVVLAGGAIVYGRGRRYWAHTDPTRSYETPLVDVMTAGVKSILPNRMPVVMGDLTVATPSDESTSRHPARPGLAALFTEPTITRREGDVAKTHADFATAGLYPK